ncbi:MAG: helix-turn-helix domain-containing protein [Clostridiaceae bacterium]
MDKLVYSVKEMAGLLNVGMNMAYNIANREDFPKIQLCRKILIPKKALEEWIEKTRIRRS